MTPILSTIYSTFKSSTTPNIISKNTKNLLSTINTKMPSSIYQFDEISYIYETTLQKFNNYQEQEKSLRKFVLLRNFYINQFLIPPLDDDQYREKQYKDGDNNNDYHIEHFNEKLEWSEDDDIIKKEEETWLNACLDDASLDEYDDGYVYVTKPEDNDQRATGKDDGIIREGERELITNYKQEIIIPNDLSLEESKNNNISDQEFHPYWKDNSIIRQQQQPSSTPNPSLPPPSIDHYRPFFDQKSQTNNVSSDNSLEKDKNDNKVKNDNETNENNSNNNNNDNHNNNSGGNFKIRSFRIPKIFHKYKLGHTILDLLQLDDQSSPYSFEQPATTTKNRSQDDLDMLFYSQQKVLLDHGMLSDIISMSMLEWYGAKKSDPLNDSNNINNNNFTNTTPIATTTTMTPTELIISTNNWLVGSGRC